MKISDDLDSDNNNSIGTELDTNKRGTGRPSGRKRQNPNKSTEKIINGVDIEQSPQVETLTNELNISKKDSSSPIVSRTLSIKRKTPESGIRDLINLHSTISPKFTCISTSPVTVLNSTDDDNIARPTRNLNNILDSDYSNSPLKSFIDGSPNEDSITAATPDLNDHQENISHDESHNTGFEADAEEAVAAAIMRKQLKRKQKRGLKSRRQQVDKDAEIEIEGEILDDMNTTADISTTENEKSETPKGIRRKKRVPKHKGKEKDHIAVHESKKQFADLENIEEDKTDFNVNERIPSNIEGTNCTLEKKPATNFVVTTENANKMSRRISGCEKVEIKLEFNADIDDAKIILEPNNNNEVLVQKKNIEDLSLIGGKTHEVSEHEHASSSIKTGKIEKISENEMDSRKSYTSEIAITSTVDLTMKSPSTESLDSAKGSSISADSAPWSEYRTGDLYWGRLFTYCFWPCMVCPDPEGRVVTQAARNSVFREFPLQLQVHVRFFADNGRRNWLKKDNMLPFAGLKAYEALKQEIHSKYGSKSPRFQQMVPKRNKILVWHQAVDEATIVTGVPYPERLEKFFKIYESSVSQQKQKRKRRSSMMQTASSTSDIGSSIYDSTDNLNAKPMLQAIKRERSESPFSPVYSPVKGASFLAKRRKLSNDGSEISISTEAASQQEEITTSLPMNIGIQQSEASATDLLRSKEYNGLFMALKDYVMGPNQDEKLERCLLSAVHNIWSLKQLNRRQMEGQLAKNTAEQELGSAVTGSLRGDGSVKRLSNRLRNLIMRRSMTPVTQTTQLVQFENKLSERRASEPTKPKKQLNRPIAEVVDDIFNLDRRYLFRGMSRDPVCKYCFKPEGKVIRCLNGCNSWLHRKCINKDSLQNQQQQKNKLPKSSEETSGRESTSTINSASTPPPLSEPASNAEHVTAETETDEDNDAVVCRECTTDAPQTCCICHQEKAKVSTPPTSPLKSPIKPNHEMSDNLVSCNMPLCNKKFHPSCCKYWPQAKISKTTVRCPAHVCHTCVSDDPSGKFQQLGSAKLTKCVKCPATYHTDSTCIPAGSQILTAANIICPRHSTTKNDMHVNVGWCYICVKGGELVCCETCPIAVHAHCRNIPIKASEGYICEECESGRLPLYGEIVWAKFNNFRWWPAIILPPTEVPTNIARKAHGPSEFVVRFFGTHDHGWISRRRVYLYIEGDAGDAPKSRSSLDQNYTNGVEEASLFLRIIKAKRQEQSIASMSASKLHPQPYIKIKSNKPVPPVKLHIDLEKVNKCECNPDIEHPCGIDSECLNRVLYNECNPKICRAGQRCENQMFESRISPRLEVVYMNERGFGLVCREAISVGSFVIEYVGEVINDAEFRQRIMQKTRDRDENFYFLTVEKDYIIDAGPKGNLARFMNHSCEPNCETQKWLVNGINRVGLFAIKDIPANTELTFNYLWNDLMDNQKKVCFCGAVKCAGEIGGKYKEESPKEAVTGLNKQKTKLNANGKNNKKLKTLKRLQSKKHIKIEINSKKSVGVVKASKTKKQISADDGIETAVVDNQP